jgi:acid phosphatase
MLAWDEYEDDIIDFFRDHHNVVSSLLLGDAIPREYYTTTQVANTKYGYSHYSILSTVELNWDLGDLDKGDKGAEPFW